MENQLVSIALISTILGALAGFAMTYAVLQPQIQGLQQTQTTWHLIRIINQTAPEDRFWVNETFQVKGNWTKIEWIPYETDRDTKILFGYTQQIMIAYPIWRGNYSEYIYKTLNTPSDEHGQVYSTVAWHVNITPGEWRLLIWMNYAGSKAFVAIWDYY